ncbi:MAG TPA: CHAP domain-containing protein [Candidatus Salinicoccus stercoripullorum]|uniref:CHAP domain-containing protein n=1 Tax=Candidatus Salinicoccus stercoripullorum TaxID=2838756 RepID=A0A9D1QGI8_9STAP|nr:CHAP domain-containing protein [Candidatus Salinicoccus stercoripullorum]
MKKTLFSLATATAITGVATGNAEAGGFDEGQDHTVDNTEQAAASAVSEYEDYSYSYEEDGYTYSYGDQASQETADTTYEAPAVEEYDAPSAPAPQTAEYEEPSAPAPAGDTAASAANHYTQGDCTWHVYERLNEMGVSVSNSWGNASNWDSAALGSGMTVSNSPSVGAIMQLDPGQGGAGSMGHVAVVEAVNADGSIQVSEMNWNGGFGVESTRTISASAAASYDFIK